MTRTSPGALPAPEIPPRHAAVSRRSVPLHQRSQARRLDAGQTHRAMHRAPWEVALAAGKMLPRARTDEINMLRDYRVRQRRCNLVAMKMFEQFEPG